MDWKTRGFEERKKSGGHSSLSVTFSSFHPLTRFGLIPTNHIERHYHFKKKTSTTASSTLSIRYVHLATSKEIKNTKKAERDGDIGISTDLV